MGIDQDDKLAMFLIQWSKMIQHCRKELWVPVMPADNKKVCLIATLKEYFEQVPAKPSDPMFCYRNKCKQLKALMYEQLAEQFKTWVKEIGMDDGKHTLHGLRCGGMTHAFQMGIKPEFIRMMGDWMPQCFFRYLDVALDDRLQAAVKFIQ